jgi:N-acetylglutamate synthase-like GNAT family acetyltransferase
MADVGEQKQLFELLRKVSEQSGSGLKPRTEEYISENIHNFITIYDEDTLVACGELIELDSGTIELGAVATNVDYQNQ